MAIDEVDKAGCSAFVEGDRALDGSVAVCDALEAMEDIVDGGWSFVGCFLESPKQEPVEVCGDRGLGGVIVAEWEFGFALHDPTQEVFEGFGPFEIMVKGEEFVEDDKEAVDIAAFVEFVVVSEGLFGGHVHGCAEECVVAGLEETFTGSAVGFDVMGDLLIEFVEEALDLWVGGCGLSDAFGDAPIHDDDFSEGTDHNVRGFEIAVDHAVAMGKLHRSQDLRTDPSAVFEGVFCVVFGVSCLEAFDDVFECDALDMLHHEVVSAFFIDADIVDGDNVGMFKASDGADLFGKSEEVCGGVEGCFEAFDGDHAVNVVVTGEFDFADSPSAEGFFEFVAFFVGLDQGGCSGA